MINLVSAEQKRTIRAARINVVLVRYCLLLLILSLITGLIYGFGFWLVNEEKKIATTQLSSLGQESKAYTDAEKEADTFRQNLAIAKQILDKETSYSKFLTTLASDVPSGTILTSLSIGSSAPVAKSQKGITLEGRASSYAKVLEMKNRLEKSILFENVSIVNASRPDDISALSGLVAKYPYEVSFNVIVSPKPPTGSTP